MSLVGSTDSHLLLALEPPASARGLGGDRLTPIRFTARHHGTYWVNEADPPPATAEAWRLGAVRHDGSWWTDWASWLAARSGVKGALPPMGGPRHQPLLDAPGSYVLEK